MNHNNLEKHRQPQTTGCSCGRCEVTIEQPPITRFHCHCSICRKLYQSDYADVVVVSPSAMTISAQSDIHYHKYRSFPAVRRGTCKHCHEPVVGTLMGLLAFVPGRNYRDPQALPELKGRIFADQNIAEDDIPGACNYWQSQWLASRLIMRGMFSR